jgi:hypothetical protein
MTALAVVAMVLLAFVIGLVTGMSCGSHAGRSQRCGPPGPRPCPKPRGQL